MEIIEPMIDLMPLLRIFPNRSRHCLPLLHAPPPTHMLSSLQRVMFVGCAGWLCRAILQPIDYFRRSAGHGD
jgi:hypothetical protein